MDRLLKILAWPWRIIIFPAIKAGTLFVGYRRSGRVVNKKRLKVLIAGGYGYANIGDEAQLAANLQYWKKIVPGCRLTVLTPDLVYTEAIHGPIRTELAPRSSLFGKGDMQYYGSEKVFKKRFFLVAALCLFNTWLIRAGLPTFGLSIRQARMLDELNNSDVLFLSGGGYLTGMTLTRLWDNMLLLRLAYALGVPTVLSGQTIGIFQDNISRELAKWGLKYVELIYLRDHAGSPQDLTAIGFPADRINCTFDDALFFEPASASEVMLCLEQHGMAPKDPYIAVNCHYWGQSSELANTLVVELAKVLDLVIETHQLHVVFVPMCHSDEEAMCGVMENMQQSSFLPPHRYEPAVAVGLIQNAALCLTLKHHPIVFAMAASVPVVSVVFDDYYWHKNLGAMKIFNQEAYLIDGRECESLSASIVERIDAALQEKEGIQRNIGSIISGLRERAGEAISIWTENNISKSDK